jgi:HK97 gp10 family phage protein
MTVKMSLTGGAELARALNAVALTVRRRALHEALRVAAEPMRQRMSDLAPRRPPHPDLADHIITSPAVKIGRIEGGRGRAREATEAAIAVGPRKDFFYGIFLEYGTVKMSAQPFMRPAFDSTRDEALTILKDELWALMEKFPAQTHVPEAGA